MLLLKVQVKKKRLVASVVQMATQEWLVGARHWKGAKDNLSHLESQSASVPDTVPQS